MNFPCTKCGLCCKNIGDAIKIGHKDPILQKAIDEFPYKTFPSGRCEMLANDNTCRVYKNRPLLCDVGKIYDKNPSLMPSKKEWFIFNTTYCNSLIFSHGLDSKFYIDLCYYDEC